MWVDTTLASNGSMEGHAWLAFFFTPMIPIFFSLVQLGTAVAFLVYGIACFFSRALTAEFERWGLRSIQRLTGGLEMLGGLGLLVGFFSSTIRFISSLGLALMMVCALLVRAKVRDRAMLWAPAALLLVITLGIAFRQ
jgi:hypothetical protein